MRRRSAAGVAVSEAAALHCSGPVCPRVDGGLANAAHRSGAAISLTTGAQANQRRHLGSYWG
jgi:hypothetical protein